MSRPGFLEGAILALILSALCAAAMMALTPLLSVPFVLRGLVTLAAGTYVMYLLHRSRQRTGRLATFVLWGIAALAVWIWSPGVIGFLSSHTLLVWLVRVLFFHSRFLPAVMDLGLCCAALMAAVAVAEQTGSLFLSVWSFFLTQALFIALPGRGGQPDRTEPDAPEEAFERAYRAADSALRRCSS